VRVLITDGEQPQTLAAVRALGREGAHVIVAAATWRAVAMLSRYCAESFVCPSAITESDAFVESVLRTAKEKHIDVLLPIAYHANVLFSRHQAELSRVARLAIAEWDAMSVASDKQRTMEFAESIGVATPKTYPSIAAVRSFPVVVKAARGAGAVRYVNSSAQLRSIDTTHAIIQEYIPGTGFGFYGLFHHGEPRAIFMHRRIREFPVTGGASTAAAAYYDDRLKDVGLSLMRSLKWHGVAMVEVKRDSRNGEYKLMEINPKFWGSLDLSIAAGVNFPYLTCRMAYDGDVTGVFDYDRTVKFRWPFPHDILHVLAKPSSAKQFATDFLDPLMRTNWSPDDWRPSLYLALATPFQVIKRLIRRQLYRPHGSPRFG
jgi:predicted ATP-grasp superfamily ATP-dependent carboligase